MTAAASLHTLPHENGASLDAPGEPPDNARVTLSGSASSPRLLLVSDDVSVSDTCSQSLQLDGFSVRVAFSPAEGLTLAERHRPQVVVVDLRIPAGPALDFVERLRRHPGLAHAPIALLTGDYFISPAQLDRMRALGVTERFRPIWLAELIDVARLLTLATVPA